MVHARRGQPAGRHRPRRRRHRRRSRAAHRLAGQPDAGAAPCRCRGSIPSGPTSSSPASRSRPSCSTGSERARITVSAFGLREGLLLEMAGAKEIAAAAIRCACSGSSPSAASAIGAMSSRCATWRSCSSISSAAELGCEPEERLLLEAAGLLHDVGQLVSYRKHHKHSYQLIMHADRLGLAPRERGAGRPDQPIPPADGSAEEARGIRGAPAGGSGGGPATERDSPRGRRARPRPYRGGRDRGDRARRQRADDPDRPAAGKGADLGLECWGASRKADVLAKLLERDVEIVAEVPTGA